MRWKTPVIGEKRIRTFFAWTPVCANYIEYRWLETVTVEEEYGYFCVPNKVISNIYEQDYSIQPTWHVHRFIDEKPIKE